MISNEIRNTTDYILTTNNNFTIFINKNQIYSNNTLKSSINENYLFDLVYICVCSFFVIFGCFGNFVSFFVFLKASRRAPRIVTKNLLILFTISNTCYLIIFWYFGILPKIIEFLKNLTNKTNQFVENNNDNNNTTLILAYEFFKSLHLVNKNKFACKTVTYLLSVSILLNALITVFFSLERAFAINFPLKTRNLRENHRGIFHFAILILVALSLLYPSYNLYLADIVEIKLTNSSSLYQCDIPEQYGKIYFNLTIIFVIKTLALPFILITISNGSILMAIYKNKKNFDSSNSSFKSIGGTNTTNNNNNRNKNKESNKISSIRSRSQRFKNNNSCRIGKGTDKNSKLTRMLVAISLSFVLFHLPYFICWCIFVNFRLNNQIKPLPPDTLAKLFRLYRNLKISEILNLFNYSITGLLYFATGKIYRQHLFSILNSIYKCKKVDLQNSTYHTYTNTNTNTN